MIYPLKIVIFHSSVSLPEGIPISALDIYATAAIQPFVKRCTKCDPRPAVGFPGICTLGNFTWQILDTKGLGLGWRMKIDPFPNFG